MTNINNITTSASLLNIHASCKRCNQVNINNQTHCARCQIALKKHNSINYYYFKAPFRAMIRACSIGGAFQHYEKQFQRINQDDDVQFEIQIVSAEIAENAYLKLCQYLRIPKTESLMNFDDMDTAIIMK